MVQQLQTVWVELQTTLEAVPWGLYVVDALKILAIIIAGRVLITFGYRVVDRLAERKGQHQALFGPERRFLTIATIAKSLIRYAVDFVAGVIVLNLLGLDTSSVLLGAGVAGLAVGFGAQSLVKDVISGFFILFEDQFSIGDYVKLGGVDGIVEEMGLRSTQVRAFGGELHTIPNGIIDLVTNYSRGAIRVLFEVEVAYEEDTSRAIVRTQEVLDRFAAGSEVVVEGPQVLGVSKLGASGVSLMVWAKVKAMEQWAVERELKLRIKRAFDEAGIEIPYPRRVFISGGTLQDPLRPGRTAQDTTPPATDTERPATAASDGGDHAPAGDPGDRR